MLYRLALNAIAFSFLAIGTAGADGSLKGIPGSCCSTWNGLYVGAHAGYAWGAIIPPTAETGRATEVSLSGGFGGVQWGYNHQVAPNWFFGVEQDLWLGRISGNVTQIQPSPRIESETDIGGTVRARFGYASSRALLYSTAGIAWAYNEGGLQYRDAVQQALAFADRLTYSDRNLHLGFALGNGVEWMVAPNVSFKAEYMFLYFTKEQYFPGTTEAALAGFHDHTVRLGVNWHLR